MDARLLEVARCATGFMPDDEGLALYALGCDAGEVGPLLEVGSYCGKSAVYLGAAARITRSLCVTVDHHRGSEENQQGWEHHDPGLVDPRTGRLDTLPHLRRTIEDAGLEDVVVAVVGDSPAIGRVWSTPLGLCFIDGGHAEDVVRADYDAWSVHVAPRGFLAFHDVFEDPRDGGQGPFFVWRDAVGSGVFEPWSSTGSLRVLRRVSERRARAPRSSRPPR